MRRRWYLAILLLSCLLPCLQALANSPPASIPPQKSILILASSDFDDSYVSAMVRGFTQNIQKADPTGIRFYYESLQSTDVNRFGFSTHSVLRPYQGKNIDLILTVGYPALAYALEHRDELDAQIPLLYVAVIKDRLATIDTSKNVTGIAADRPLRSFTTLAKEIFPRASRLVIIGDTAQEDRHRSYFSAEVADASQILPIVDMRGKLIDDVRNEISRLPQGSIIYYTRLTRDGNGRVFSPEAILRSLAAESNAPILVDIETWLGKGVLASQATPIAARSDILADMGLKVLRSGSVSEVPAISMTDTVTFNWPEAEKWGLTKSDLPDSALVRFYEPSFMQQHKSKVIVVAGILFVLLLIIIALLLERRQRSIALKRSHQYLGEMAHVNRSTTAIIYSSAIAHELNQPLAAITSNADALEMFLQKTPPDLDQANEIVTDIKNDSKRASDLIKRMRSMVKKEEGTQILVNMDNLIDETLKFLNPEIRMRRAKVTTIYSSSGAWVKGDPIQLQQVFTNLVINSMDAMADLPPGQKQIDIETRINGKRVEVRIQDSGSGFGEHAERVFESFFTTKEQGLGLGLAITTAILENHGGSVVASNAPEGGALVTVMLPIVADAPEA